MNEDQKLLLRLVIVPIINNNIIKVKK
jgi:hypothetical protein